jgi:hypothetical protein
MTETPALIETSFAQATAVILTAEELPEQTRRHWATSLRQFARLSGRPLEVIPARYSAVRADLFNLHEVPAGLTAKTLQNHKSNVKRALLWLAKEKGIPEHGAPLAPAWEALRGKMRDGLVRYRLSSLMRFASANGVAPEEVDEAVIDRLIAYRSGIGQPADNAFRRLQVALEVSASSPIRRAESVSSPGTRNRSGQVEGPPHNPVCTYCTERHQRRSICKARCLSGTSSVRCVELIPS